MKTKIINYINKYGMLNGCGSIVMGLSGGADSVCLLLILDELCRHKKESSSRVLLHGCLTTVPAVYFYGIGEIDIICR